MSESMNDRFADLLDSYEMEPLESWDTSDLSELEGIIAAELQERYHDERDDYMQQAYESCPPDSELDFNE